MIGAVDLFGLPVDPGHGQRGRPRHVPTPDLRARVLDLRGDGRSHDDIAAQIGVTGPTLRMHYFEELGSSSQVWRRRAITSEVGNVEQD